MAGSYSHKAAIGTWMVLIATLCVFYLWFYRKSPRLPLNKGLLALIFLGTLTSPAVLESDQHRYIWDGLVSITGDNPFAMSPQEYAGPLSGVVWRQKINHPHLPTIYPPLAQGLFALSGYLNPYFWKALGRKNWKLLNTLAPWQWELGWKMLVGACGLLTAFLYRYDRWELIVAHPLFLLQFLINGHLDGFLVPLLFFIGFAGGKNFLKPLALAAGMAIKIYPLILLPFMDRRLKTTLGYGLFTIVLVFLVYQPYVEEARNNLFTSLLVFGHHWSFFAYLHAWMTSVVSFLPFPIDSVAWAKCVALLIGVSIAGGLWWRDQKLPVERVKVCYILLFSFWALSPTIHPWYLISLIPFAVALRKTAVAGTAWTLLGSFSVFFYVDNEDPVALRHAIYTLITGFIFYDLKKMFFPANGEVTCKLP